MRTAASRWRRTVATSRTASSGAVVQSLTEQVQADLGAVRSGPEGFATSATYAGTDGSCLWDYQGCREEQGSDGMVRVHYGTASVPTTLAANPQIDEAITVDGSDWRIGWIGPSAFGEIELGLVRVEQKDKGEPVNREFRGYGRGRRDV